ncbi:MAG: hypothetical protein HY670_07345 [Chloroflexi bacterium]|nr:hypothetical protein [Chloroflexota bacterium]
MSKARVRGGWAGKILKVDLSRNTITEEPLSDELAFGLLGGRGFDAKFLWDLVKPGIDPLGSENVLSLGAGLLSGTIFPESGRINVGCLSPLTGIYGCGNAGGWWPSRLKAAGYDHIIITGRAARPVYILINDDGAQIKDAGDLWGMTTYEMEKALRDRHGRDIRVCGIGPAGENLVRTAATIVDGSFSAHGGSGAVWGSKNLKAIAVTGTKPIAIGNPEKFYELARREAHRLRHPTRPIEISYQKYGTLHLYDMLTTFVGYGADHRYLDPEENKKLFAANLFEKYCTGYHSCGSNCMENCTYLWEVNVGPYAGTRTAALRFGSTDYMTLGMGNSDTGSMVKFHNLCNEYGLCGKMMPTALSFALELYERGILTKEDTGGIEIKAGDHETIIEMTHMTAFREGFGNILAEGPLNMARTIKGAYPHRHGMYGRTYTIGLSNLTGNRGTDHLSSFCASKMSPEEKTRIYNILVKHIPSLMPPAVPGVKGKGAWMVWEENGKAVFDSIGRCMSGGVRGGIQILADIDQDPYGEERAKLLSVLIGAELSAEEVQKCGERAFNLERAFNIRQGGGRDFEILPEHDRHIQFDLLALSKVGPDDMREFFQDYYQARGWDADGVPTRAKLEELGLGYVADELETNLPYPRWQGPPLWPLDKYPSGGKRPRW